jgi:glycosyltransferase involved in cell wall biosynthesis
MTTNLRVLHLPVGRQMIEMCNSLRAIGVYAKSCHFRQRSMFRAPDICLNLELLSSAQRRKRRESFLTEAIKHYDVFHFHFGETFLKDRSDLELLKKHGKKLVVQHRGSDVRMLSIAQSYNNRHVRVKEGRRRSEVQIIQKLKELSSYIDHVIVADHELLPYVEKYYKHIHILRQFITLERFKPSYPSRLTARPLIVHAPTNSYLKGTEFVLEAIQRLRRNGYEFEFTLVEGMTQENAIQCYRKADIIIDQLLQGSFGVFSLEGMALGKPVLCYIRKQLLNKYPPGLPIVVADKISCYEALRKLIQEPERRLLLGKAGRQYIERYYHSHMLAKQLKLIYKQL